MLKPAAMYENELKLKFAEIEFEEEYQFHNTNSWREPFKANPDTWNKHQFAVVNEDGEVIGFIGYSIDRDALTVSGLHIVNFKKDTLSRTFGRDLHQAICDIFLRFKFRKLNFTVVIGNPAEAFYDKYIGQMGGRIVGHYEKDVKLMDGEYYDLKLYEVMRENFIDAHRKTTGG